MYNFAALRANYKLISILLLRDFPLFLWLWLVLLLWLWLVLLIFLWVLKFCNFLITFKIEFEIDNETLCNVAAFKANYKLSSILLRHKVPPDRWLRKRLRQPEPHPGVDDFTQLVDGSNRQVRPLWHLQFGILLLRLKIHNENLIFNYNYELRWHLVARKAIDPLEHRVLVKHVQCLTGACYKLVSNKF